MPRNANIILPFSSFINNQYLDRYGRLREIPDGAISKTRIGIFGITISLNEKFLVTYPAHALDVPSLPGGGREGFETHAQALQREYFEELGPYFLIKEKKKPVYQHRILYYASDANEYWQYDQYFYFTEIRRPKLAASRWITPEGGRAQWIPLRAYQCLTASHQPAVKEYLKMKEYNRRLG